MNQQFKRHDKFLNEMNAWVKIKCVWEAKNGIMGV